MNLRLRSNHILQQFITYCGIGGIAFIADFLVLDLCISKLGIAPMWAASAGFVVGAIVNYCLCLQFVFSVRVLKSQRWREFAIFVLIGLGGLLLNDFLIYIAHSAWQLSYREAKPLAAIGVLFFNFIGRKVILFSGPDVSSVEPAPNAATIIQTPQRS